MGLSLRDGGVSVPHDPDGAACRRMTSPLWSAAVRRYLPDLPSLFVLDQIALCGEREDGRFEVIHRYKLTG